MTSGFLRLFYAVQVPAWIKNNLGQACQKLPAAWRPVQADQMHLTLVFMGEVPAEALDSVVAVGDQTAANLSPFEVKLGELDCFPNRGKPRVLFVQAHSDGLIPLATGLQGSLREWADSKPFRPHLTIARKKLVGALFQAIMCDQSWTVDSFDLIRSQLGAGRAEHILVKTFPLSRG